MQKYLLKAKELKLPLGHLSNLYKQTFYFIKTIIMNLHSSNISIRSSVKYCSFSDIKQYHVL